MQQVYLVFGVAVVIWLIALSFFVFRAVAHYNNLVKRGGKYNLQKILENILTDDKDRQLQVEKLESELALLNKEKKDFIQKVGILRFNPFENTGGDQSFVLAVLDGEDTGIVLSSLHSRGVTRWYAKNVKGGKGVDHELSKEENLAIKNALKLKTKDGKN